jgi:hypothetical protein
MLKELRELLLNNSSFPDEGKFENPEMKAQLIEFKGKFKPNRSINVDISTVKSFLAKHRFFEIYREYLKDVRDLGARIILVEGADAVGKTSLTVPLSKKLNAAPIDNQSANMFYEMFGMPRPYKVVVADYNDNISLGLLFYMCMNLYALRKVVEAFEKGYKYAIIDSSLLRTLSARIAIPVVGNDNELLIDKEIYALVKNELNTYYLDAVSGNRDSLFFVFMYASDGVRREQSKADEGREYILYESNKKYSKFVEQYLRENQIVLRRLGVPLISMLLVTPRENERATAMKSKFSVDEVFVRTDDINADVEKKVSMVLDAMSKDPKGFRNPKCCWL